jgi:hypothetical protein
MADIAQILALPVPLRNPLPDPTAQYRGGAGGTADSTAENGGRARRFRFRVYESGSAAAGIESNARRTGVSIRPQLAHSGNRGPAAASVNAAQPAGKRNTVFQAANTGTSSAFLAQSIAQEQLGPGLHNPPHAAAAAAYAQAGSALTARLGMGVRLSV